MESVGVIMYKKYDYKKPKLIASKLYESNDDVAISVAPQDEQKRRRFDNVCVDLKKYARSHNGKLEISISEKNVGYIKPVSYTHLKVSDEFYTLFAALP